MPEIFVTARVSRRAIVHRTAVIGGGCTVGPLAIIGRGAVLADGARVAAGAIVGGWGDAVSGILCSHAPLPSQGGGKKNQTNLSKIISRHPVVKRKIKTLEKTTITG
jgi:NDP-sugar pyrophosphorylase family protein